MSSILSDILEAEKRAREAALEAEKYRDEAVSEIEKEKKRIIDSRIEEARKQVEILREQHKKEHSLSTKSAEDRNLSDIERLRALGKEKKEQWIDEIFARVISDEA